MKVAALQFDVRRGDVRRNLAAAVNGLRQAADRGIELVVLPEMWPTSFAEPTEPLPEGLRASDEAVERLGELSASLGLVVCGSAYGAVEGEPKPRNRLHVFDRGRLILSYDKVHLFSPTAEGETFSAGRERPPTVASSLGRLTGIVCYDLRFAPLLPFPQLGETDLLVVVAQWPAARATHWRALVLGKAVESQLYVVAANRTGTDRVGRRGLELSFPGNSLVADPHGQVLAEGVGQEGLVTAEIDPEDGRRLRTRVPVARDVRGELYQGWSLPGIRADRG